MATGATNKTIMQTVLSMAGVMPSEAPNFGTVVMPELRL